jgi:hypothetical protein
MADDGLSRLRLHDLAADRFEVVDRRADEPDVAERMLRMLQQRRGEVARDPLRPRTPGR